MKLTPGETLILLACMDEVRNTQGIEVGPIFNRIHAELYEQVKKDTRARILYHMGKAADAFKW